MLHSKLIPALLISIIVLMLNADKVFAQVTAREITDKFFEIYAKDPAKAVEYAFSTNKWTSRKQDEIDNLKLKLKGMIELVGEYYGFELLAEKTAGESLKLITFYVKYNREPVRFSFFLYKPKDKWQVQNFSFDEDLDDDLEEAAKLYRLRENNQ